MTIGYIYALVDPRNPDHECYIGKTIRPLALRLQRHCNIDRGDQSYRARWIAKLRREGFRPLIREIAAIDLSEVPERVQTPLLNCLEIAAIAVFRKLGRAEKNILNGGDGFDSATVKKLMQRMGKVALQARARKGVERMTKEALLARGQKVREARAQWTPEREAEVAAKIKAKITPEKRAAGAAKATLTRQPMLAAMVEKRKKTMTPEKRAASAAKRAATMTPERYAAATAKAMATLLATPGAMEAKDAKRLATMTPEKRTAAAMKAYETVGPEGRRESAKLAAQTRRAKEGRELPIGVYLRKENSKPTYRATAWERFGKGRVISLGSFATPAEAAAAVEAYHLAHPETTQ